MKLRRDLPVLTHKFRWWLSVNSGKMASVITHVFNPALIAAFTFLTLLYPYNSSSPILVEISLTFGTIIPLATVYVMSKRGMISDFLVANKDERAKPFAGAILSYVLGSLALWSLRAPKLATALMLCYAGNTIIMMLITRLWKISVHASGIAGPTTALIEAFGAWVSILFLLLIPVGWARIRLKAHTPSQILAGALVTIIATWLQFGIYLAVL